MSHIIIDRTTTGKGKSAANRQKLKARVKERTKKAVQRAVQDGKIADINSDKSEEVTVPAKDVHEPTFHHTRGGITERVHPGNKDFIEGDRIAKPQGGGEGGGGRQGSPDGEGDDDFVFTITRDEFLEYFFEDLELPNLEDRCIAKTETFERKRAGFVSEGDPGRMDLVRSMKNATGRRMALRFPKKRKLRELEKELADLEAIVAGKPKDQVSIELDRIKAIKHEIEVLKRKIAAVPYVDEMDLRFAHSVKMPVPTSQAVMFCVMDVSGSMGEWEKEMAKRFYMLLYLFLTRQYEHIELVFIRHHTTAKEVDEEEFFYSRETGGTLVSPALKMMRDIIDERYPTSQWNIYGCQASDGDNWDDDNRKADEALRAQILPLVQYYAYIEIRDRSYGGVGDLWPTYQEIKQSHSNFDMANITDASDIYPVFRGLFEKQ